MSEPTTPSAPANKTWRGHTRSVIRYVLFAILAVVAFQYIVIENALYQRRPRRAVKEIEKQKVIDGIDTGYKDRTTGLGAKAVTDPNGAVNDFKLQNAIADGAKAAIDNPASQGCSDLQVERPTPNKIVLTLLRTCGGKGGATNLWRRPRGDRATYRWHISDWTVPQYTEFNQPALDLNGKPLVLPGGPASVRDLHDENCPTCCQPAPGGGQICTLSYEKTNHLRVEMKWPGGHIEATRID